MIALVTIVLLSVSVLLSTFLGFSPNYGKLVQSDYMNRINANTVLYGLQFGDVAVRAKTLNIPNAPTITRPLRYTRKKNNVELDQMDCKLTLILDPVTLDKKIRVKKIYKSPK
jgi:hypothetical protein